MAQYKVVKDRKYFIYNHDERYQRMHHAFLVKYNNTPPGTAMLMHVDEARKNMHVEALIEVGVQEQVTFSYFLLVLQLFINACNLWLNIYGLFQNVTSKEI